MGNDRESRQRELARILIQKARQDLAAVGELRDSAKVADEIVGFHAQQTIEKSLKAVLTRAGVEYGNCFSIPGFSPPTLASGKGLVWENGARAD